MTANNARRQGGDARARRRSRRAQPEQARQDAGILQERREALKQASEIWPEASARSTVPGTTLCTYQDGWLEAALYGRLCPDEAVSAGEMAYALRAVCAGLQPAV